MSRAYKARKRDLAAFRHPAALREVYRRELNAALWRIAERQMAEAIMRESK